MLFCREVSIHAPARGATCNRQFLSYLLPCFNPRPRTGGDVCIPVCADKEAVSIHAPARGATNFLHDIQICSFCFNPRPRTGGATPNGAYPCTRALFQSTPPHGGRRAQITVGSTEIFVSIHAPARGATSPLASPYITPVSFNPRPRTGGDCYL